jgi:regulator of sigma E protease
MLFSIIIFVIILGALIFIHELGHFLVAKKSGIRVDEFAVGFPPKIFSFKKGGTTYALNSIPFGGYVKIFGEELNDETLDPNKTDSFVNKSKWIQVAVLSAGVIFNVIFAWILLTIILLMGGKTGYVTESEYFKIEESKRQGVFILDVLPNSPALENQIPAYSKILSISNEQEEIEFANIVPSEVIRIVAESQEIVNLKIQDSTNLEIKDYVLNPNQDGKKALGISLSSPTVFEETPFYMAPIQALKYTYYITFETTKAFGNLINESVRGKGSLDNVAGPIGIVKLVDKVSDNGFIKILEFTALISINLAILNILPFPALDGGRIAMVAYEGVTRRRIKSSIANTINTVGFLILIGLMILITVGDVFKSF